MASIEEIAKVRQNTNEATAERWEDSEIGAMVDANGVNGASAEIWRAKAASYAELVNVSEAGASHAFGDLQQKANDMASLFEEMDQEELLPRARVKVIERPVAS